ncbi:MAG: hypothetical protein HYR60_20120 [Acidobacteria bacterium]|nr:hypothetical protein [Acidobacteriota bacterium]
MSWTIARGIAGVITAVLVTLYAAAYVHDLGGRPPEKQLTVPQFVADVRAGKIKQVTIYPDGELRGVSVDLKYGFRTMVPPKYTKLYEVLDEHGVEFVAVDRGVDWMTFCAGAAAMWVFLILRSTYHSLMALADKKSRPR